VKGDPENTPNVYARYYQALQAELTRKKEKAEKVTADKKLNMAMTKNDSVFKNISLPGGISTKATEYKSRAEKGDTWSSDVFDIGSASETRDIPRPTQVTRRSPHRHQKHQVRDREDTSGSMGTYGSRDSGYHGIGNDASPTSGFGTNLAKTNEHGTNQNALKGGYSLNTPVGTNPVVGPGNNTMG